MVSMFEHLALVMQLVLTYLFSSYIMFMLTALVWLVFLLIQATFNLIFFRHVVKNDQKFSNYRQHSENKAQSQWRAFLGITVNWRCYKLLYSHIFGFHVNEFHFSDTRNIVRLYYGVTLASTIALYLPWMLINVYGLM